MTGEVSSPAASPQIVLAVPMYRCEAQIARVIRKLDALGEGIVDRVVLIDNQSPDRTLEVALDEVRRSSRLDRFTVLRNNDNYGLGGSHKIGFEYALRSGASTVAILHGDDQAHVPDLVRMLDVQRTQSPDAVLGGRFSRGAVRKGYSLLRTAGNILFNHLLGLVLRRRVDDLGAGLNVYSTRALESRFYLRFADDLTFNVHLLIGQAFLKQRLVWHPITWREEDQDSNVRLVSQGLATLGIVSAAARQGRAMLARDLRLVVRREYQSAVVTGSGPLPGESGVRVVVPS